MMPLSTPHVLIIDDDPMMRELFAAVLNRAGFHTSCAGSCAEADERLEERIPDLILLDMQLGQSNGLEFAHELLQRPVLCGVPVVAVSASDGMEECVRSAGCVGFVQKPINPRTFAASVTDYIRLRATAAARQPNDTAFTNMKRSFLAGALRTIGELSSRTDEELLLDRTLADAAHRWAGASGLDGLPDVLNLARSLESMAMAKEARLIQKIRFELACLGASFREVADALGPAQSLFVGKKPNPPVRRSWG